jgi:hypothetical protein
VQVVNVMLADQGVALASPQLKEQGTGQRQDGMMMRAYTGEALAAGQSLAFDLNGIPKVTPTGAGNAPMEPSGAATAPPVPAPDYRRRVALGIAALGLALLVAGAVWWARSGRPTKDDDLVGVAAEHKALVQALADLDEAHEAREIGDADYVRQRQTLKAALMSALENSSVAT